MCQNTSRVCYDFHNTLLLSVSWKLHCSYCQHLNVPSVTQTSPTECDLQKCVPCLTQNIQLLSYDVQFLMCNSLICSLTFVHHKLYKAKCCKWILWTKIILDHLFSIFCWPVEVSHVYIVIDTVTLAFHCCQKQKQRSRGAKELDWAKHGKGCSVPMGQARPLHLKTQSLTHTHLRSPPTHLHKGQSLWQPQWLLCNLGKHANTHCHSWADFFLSVECKFDLPFTQPC